MGNFFVSIGKLIALILFGIFIYYGYQFVDTFISKWTPKQVLLWASLYVLLVVVGMTSFVGACLLIFRISMEIFNGFAALITQIIGNIFAVIMSKFSPPIEAETSMNGGGGGEYTPSITHKQMDANRVGEAVRDYMEENKTKFKKLRFSPYESGIMDEIYEGIGHPAVVGNKQEYNLKFGKFLLSSKYFEADGNHIKLNPLYTKEVELAAKTFEKNHANSESASLVHEVKEEYGSSNLGQKADTSRTLVGQE